MRRVSGLALALMIAASGARAQAPGDTLRYRVHRGDTLASIARAYLNRPADAAAVARASGLPPAARLRPGATIAIPRSALRAVPLDALVVAFRGAVTIDGRAVRWIGVKVPEGTLIETKENASISLRLGDGSTITLPSQSAIRIARLRRLALGGTVERRFRLEQGRSSYGVTHARLPGDTFEVQTPVSVAAVRGTEFRVAVADGERAATAEVLDGNVGVAGAAGAIALPKGFGARSDAASAGQPIPLLPAPVLLPTVGLKADGEQIVRFKPVPGAVAYRVVLARDPAFVDLRGEGGGPGPEVSLPPLADGDFYVRATAIDAHGLEGFPATYPYRHRAIAPVGAAAAGTLTSR